MEVTPESNNTANNLPSFYSIVSSQFAFLVDNYGCKIEVENTKWLQSIVFRNDLIEVKVQVGGKAPYFNLLVIMKNEQITMPLWAICKAEKYQTLPVEGVVASTKSLENHCKNSANALVNLFSNILNFNRSQVKKVDKVVQKQLLKTTKG